MSQVFNTVISEPFRTYNVSIVAREKIVINSVSEGRSITTEFRVGDVAEYDSYNLKYLGEIVSITEKTVTILPKYETKKRRLNLREFCWRNYDFNLEQVIHENHVTSMYI